MVLQDDHVLGHEELVQLVCEVHSLPGRELIRLCDHAQHILLLEVEMPDVLVKCGIGADAVNLHKVHLVVHNGLLGEWAWW
tara:strand:- start:224 stop:466 length:243 start_codon:yes stop_codon:yes gene_type:complete